MSSLWIDVCGEWKCLSVALYFRFSAIEDVTESHGVLERISFTGHLLWVRNGERNATLVIVVVIVPCVRSVKGMWDLLMWSGMVGEVQNTICLRMDSYFKYAFVEGAI
uniref:Uncharacterized protein n=1 Tax=Ficus carica TaxID=3494 RepID=A0AA88JH81_FICCA|nr:hypothetical protein TIFTF001_054192 [Ficus carica]GMN72260.1 hypothetical protein TIFTF001_054195 [Ficus carica]